MRVVATATTALLVALRSEAVVADRPSKFISTTSINTWWEGLWGRQDGCNVQELDFGVITFAFYPDDVKNKLKESNGNAASAVPVGSKLSTVKCEWKYDELKAPATWLDGPTPKDTLKKNFAVQLLNMATTALTAKCDWTFQPTDKKLDAVTVSLYKALTLRNCDFPRLNAKEPSDQGRFIKDTCEDSWTKTAEGRRPAPFQACQGDLVFPSIYDLSLATTTYTSVDQVTSLDCCTSDELPLTTFACRDIPIVDTVRRCKEEPVAVLYAANKGATKAFGLGKHAIDATFKVLSLTVVERYEIVGFKQDDTVGKVWFGGVSELESGWNGNLVSILVRRATKDNAVIAFTGKGKTGVARTFATDVVFDKGVDTIKSIQVQPGYKAILKQQTTSSKQFDSIIFGEAPNSYFNVDTKATVLSLQVQVTGGGAVIALDQALASRPLVGIALVALVVGVAVVYLRRSDHSDDDGYIPLLH